MAKLNRWIVRLSLGVVAAAFLISPSFALNSTLQPALVPGPLIRAMREVHEIAGQTKLRSLFMYKYTYYAAGYCADQDCSPKHVQEQVDLFKEKMGADFPRLNLDLPYYAYEIQYAQKGAKHRDLDNLISYRSASDIISRRVFISCLDFAKAVAAKAIGYGMSPDDLRFFWAMDTEAYFKMCPTRSGQPAVLPRPTVHTIIAYRHRGGWYVMNSENPNPEIIPLTGPPARLKMNLIFAYPPLVSGLPLIYAGGYDFRPFLGGFDNQVMLNITANGALSADPNDFVCR